MSQSDRFYGEHPLVFAHRGASDMAPENTLAAFEAAITADADGIELDVTRCATGEIVVIHDDTLERTTNGSGRVDKTPWAALRELDAGSWFAPTFAGQRVPLLTEVLDLVGHRLRINVELKGITSHPTGMEQEVAEMIHARGLADEVILSSFNPSALWRARKVAPELRRGLLYATQLPIYLARAWSRLLLQPNALHPEFHIVNATYLHWAQQRGYHVNVWTVNEPQDMQVMIRLGVDAIITNHPARLRAMLPR
jgi:glycerophosphoryl diester phosphodiesterase